MDLTAAILHLSDFFIFNRAFSNMVKSQGAVPHGTVPLHCTQKQEYLVLTGATTQPCPSFIHIMSHVSMFLTLVAIF